MVTTASDEMTDIRLKISHSHPILLDGKGMTDQEFHTFCLKNPELRIERDSSEKIIIIPPTTSETGRLNSKIHIEIGIWNKMNKLGETFDSSTGFKLPNGAERSPDTAWILKERWSALPDEQKQKFAAITPDFVLELRSKDQSLVELREKMDEYMACGCRLGWLLDPQNRRTYIYAENGDIQTVKFEETLTGGDVMPGLEILLSTLLE